MPGLRVIAKRAVCDVKQELLNDNTLRSDADHVP